MYSTLLCILWIECIWRENSHCQNLFVEPFFLQRHRVYSIQLHYLYVEDMLRLMSLRGNGQQCRMGLTLLGYRSSLFGGQEPGFYPHRVRRSVPRLAHSYDKMHQNDSIPQQHSEAYPWPPRPPEEANVWTEDMFATLDAHRRIFCNRSLNMGSIKCIGFDFKICNYSGGLNCWFSVTYELIEILKCK